MRIALYLVLTWTGFLASIFLRNLWFLLVNFYLAPVVRFGSFKSFSLGTMDCTFNTEDGGLHVAGGQLIYAFAAPVVFIHLIHQEREQKQKDRTLE